MQSSGCVIRLKSFGGQARSADFGIISSPPKLKQVQRYNITCISAIFLRHNSDNFFNAYICLNNINDFI
jgi:hypothetical protein